MVTSKDSTNLGTSKANERTIVILFFRTSYNTQQCFVRLNNKTHNKYYRNVFKLKLQTALAACLVMLRFSYMSLAINRNNIHLVFFRREEKLYS